MATERESLAAQRERVLRKLARHNEHVDHLRALVAENTARTATLEAELARIDDRLGELTEGEPEPPSSAPPPSEG